MSAIVTILGRLTRDSEETVIGKSNALKFSVAVDSGYGEKKSTIFFNVAYFRNADALKEYLVKGTQVMVSGELSINEYQDKEGKTKTSVNLSASTIKLAGSKSDNKSSEEALARPAPRASTPSRTPPPRAAATEIPNDEDVPF